MFDAYFYDAEGKDRKVKLGAALLKSIGEQQLLWIDIERTDSRGLSQLAKLLDLSGGALDDIRTPPEPARLDNHGGHFQFSVAAPPAARRGPVCRLDMLVGAKWLLTVRDHDIEFLRAFREQDRAESMRGAMSPAVIAASLLDWHLESYFDAIGEVETAIDKLDGEILGQRADKAALSRLAEMRRRVGVLRARAGDQRGIFHGLVRPDFAPIADTPAAEHYHNLAARFDRVVDAVERAREVVVGSIELFATRAALDTNELVKLLTFTTVVIGFAAAIAGIFGMNFETPFFKTGQHGFYTVLGLLLFIAIGSTILARRRNWI